MLNKEEVFTMKKILILSGDAAEALEVMYPLQRCNEEGYSVILAAPSIKVIQTVVHDFEPGFDTYTEKAGYRIKADLSFKDIRPEDYAGLILPGGRAPEYIRNNEDCRRIVSHFMDNNKPVAAICHAALILIAIGAVSHRTLTAYPELKPDIESAGGSFVDREVVVDGNLVTSRAWPDHPAFLREFFRLLK